jgi:hypothetical protein
VVQSSAEEVAPAPKATRVSFGLTRQGAAKWLAKKAMGKVQDKLSRELKELKRQRRHHEMLVPITLTTLNAGRTRSIRALLDNGYVQINRGCDLVRCVTV